MRGSDERSGSLFRYVNLESRVRKDHPLRTVREIANAALSDLSKDFDTLYTEFGRPGCRSRPSLDLFPDRRPGRSREVHGDAHPRGMAIHLPKSREGQNPAYRPSDALSPNG